MVVPRQRNRNGSLSNRLTRTLSVCYIYAFGLIWCCCMLSASRILAMSLSASSKTIVVIGGGIQGVSVAYYLAQHTASTSADNKIIVLESNVPASAASGKGGGFMARSWGDGSPTQRLHEIAFDLFEQELSTQLPLTSYRKLPVLSVIPGTKPVSSVAKRQQQSIVPNWLNGKVGAISLLGAGDDTAQVTPTEVVDKMLRRASDRVQVILGTCTGITSVPITDSDEPSQTRQPTRRVTGVTYVPRSDKPSTETPVALAADAVCVSAGPWSCAAEDWFDGAVQLPMDGIKSDSMVWKPPTAGSDQQVDATALFCGEDRRFGTELEVYPRPDGTIYVCGIGGSDYITNDQLKEGAMRDECLPNEARVNDAVNSFHILSEQYQAHGKVDRVQCCMRPCPPDAIPYMGRIPGFQGAYVNAGHNCWGIAWAPACGKAMAELILQGNCQLLDLSPFDPARFTPAAVKGSRGRKQRGTNVGEQW